MARTPKSAGMLARRKASKVALKRVLIVCEGIRTEPLYFRDMIATLELTSAQVDVEPSTSTCPANLVRYAEKRKREEDFDAVYCVFDKDTHEHFPDAIARLKGFKGRKIALNIEAIYSIPCFELWLLLHDGFSTKAYLTATELINDLKKSERFANYVKAKRGIFQAMRKDLKTALKHARKLDGSGDDFGLSNPLTKVYRLVEELFNLSEEQDKLLTD
ncbi:RloB family protein [Caballeronia sp. BCC1704]|uniref:RloB family protein n=1 Tax=Caballeronia sp. BCC1704 TaxID=2676300 RepID=UPI00158A4125|nr:RloB family protein [Caballeronia sp. BCC1704]